ncbi:MAG: NAD(P)-dependent alcohol dehydrogenase [Myxococcota bacterium]
MQTAIIKQYGPSSSISVVPSDPGPPAAGEVRLSVQAAAINPYDWHQLTGTPWLVRNETGWRRPKFAKLGSDVAGIVEAVGNGVDAFSKGDAVFGRAAGALAETAIARVDDLVRKPPNLSFEEAASLPIAGQTALQGLRDHGGIEAGMRVLINGASGGVGTYAVQLARHFGAHVTAVCSGRNTELVRSLGAHRTVDYTRDDFTHNKGRYDLVFDVVGNRKPRHIKRCLRARGTWVVVSGPKNPLFGPMGYWLRAALSFALSRKRARFFITLHHAADMSYLGRLSAVGKLQSVVERVFPLTRVAEAFAHLESGRTRGKIVVAPDCGVTAVVDLQGTRRRLANRLEHMLRPERWF